MLLLGTNKILAKCLSGEKGMLKVLKSRLSGVEEEKMDPFLKEVLVSKAQAEAKVAEEYPEHHEPKGESASPRKEVTFRKFS